MCFAVSVNLIVIALTWALQHIVNNGISYLQDLKAQKASMISLFNNLPDAIINLRKVDAPKQQHPSILE